VNWSEGEKTIMDITKWDAVIAFGYTMAIATNQKTYRDVGLPGNINMSISIVRIYTSRSPCTIFDFFIPDLKPLASIV